ncbi:MAG: rhodanese-like domain-containing protein [Sedimenticola sp.]
MIKKTLLLLFTLTLSFTLSAKPLVDSEWLQANKGNEALVILDLQPEPAYQRYHIPGAVNSNYGDWRRENSKGVAQMMTPPKKLGKLIGKLGIDNKSLVLLVTTGSGAGDMATAARVYWSFKALGHDNISILDGGLIGYANKRRYPLQKGVNRPEEKTFNIALREHYLPDAAAVKQALSEGALAVDNRSRAEFLGIYLAGGKERTGNLPQAVNLNYEWLTLNGGGTMQSPDNLKKIYTASQVPVTGPQINYCHTGHRAALGWFVSHELLGNTQARLYDGSTTEWAVKPSLPMELQIKLAL